MKFKGKEVIIIKGELEGTKGIYLGFDGYTGAGVICKLQLENETRSFRWDYFRFTCPGVHEAWEEDDELEELDY